MGMAEFGGMIMKQTGYTLIELLVSVFILGLVMLIAIPSYMNYAIRAKVSEGLNLANPVKLAVSETFLSNGEFPDSNSAAGAPENINSHAVASIEVLEKGLVKILFKAHVIDANIPEPTLILEPMADSGRVQWNCTGGSLPDQYRPSICIE